MLVNKCTKTGIVFSFFQNGNKLIHDASSGKWKQVDPRRGEQSERVYEGYYLLEAKRLLGEPDATSLSLWEEKRAEFEEQWLVQTSGMSLYHFNSIATMKLASWDPTQNSTVPNSLEVLWRVRFTTRLHWLLGAAPEGWAKA